MADNRMGYDRQEELDQDVGDAHERTLVGADYPDEAPPHCGCTERGTGPECRVRGIWHKPVDYRRGWLGT